ncbi:MAG: L-threonine 3-dehydrogenase [Candidatus Cloacimonetes bacterium]|nr:L-threonine 3-dehydrogenase [Candidatus Cloacimonadota bacterium]MBS3767392.1 L-threonine 3-dehydrogenase [Candidatus Cloacimonadota bacterium]
MTKILVTGAVGQIGSELTMELRERYGNENVVAGVHRTQPEGELKDSGPHETVDCTDTEQIKRVVEKYNIDTIYHLAAILSAVAEEKPHLAWKVNIDGLYNVLEVAREFDCAVFTPSSIGAFGKSTPLDNTPQDTIQRPSTMYGVTKVSGELLCDYYYKRFGVDTRGLRYPGIISNVTLPGGGTTDYAVEIYYEAIKNGKYTCNLKKGTFLDMMYMPDAIKGAIDLMEADGNSLTHRNAFNVTAMSFEPEMIAESIKKFIPEFTMDYDVDPVKQEIADSWPNKMDDSAARQEWGWDPQYDLDAMTKDMIKVLRKRLK